MLLSVNKIALSADLHELSFVEKRNCQRQKAYQKQHHRMPRGLTRFHNLFVLGNRMILGSL